MNLKNLIKESIQTTLQTQFKINPTNLEIQSTRKEFEGDFTLVVFPLVKELKLSPEQAANAIGEQLVQTPMFSKFNVVKGFLNLTIDPVYFGQFLQSKPEEISSTNQKLMVEFASPNTNKPLHLGHIRNILLGNSTANILKAAGNQVLRAQVVNDRGIHICKSMLAWQKFGEGETPESTGLKGDKLVGNYYVEFDQHYRKEIKDLENQGIATESAKKEAPLLLEAQQMLREWEEGDPQVRELWSMMNQWVYDGFGQTFDRLGVDFDVMQYESKTYLLGKDLIQKGLDQGVFQKNEDGSVFIDLTEDGLDKKILLRSDGTAVYMTQDLGTAVERFEDYQLNGLTYVVGNEQDYHFKVLFLILKKLGYEWADQLYHLSYGMVDLPDGKMKSREGTVVDADDLMEEMKQTAKEIALESGKLDGLSEEEKDELFEIIGQGALKYYILKVDPKKRILFNPKESIDFNGNTGPFLQYAYVRIQSILRKEQPQSVDFEGYEWSEIEKDIIKSISDYQEVIEKAAKELSPAQVANYVYDLVKLFNSFYQNHSILNADTEQQKQVRLQIAKRTGETIAQSLNLLGIKTPERM